MKLSKKIRRLPLLIVAATFGFASLFAGETTPINPPDVPYPEGYRDWRFICSVVLPSKEVSSSVASAGANGSLTSGLIHNVYANEKAREGFRTGRFPEGSVLIADWFVLVPAGPMIVQGPRKSINVMVRDARYTATGGWGFEDFDKDSRTIRNVGPNAVKSCFECHRRAEDHEFVFNSLKP